MYSRAISLFTLLLAVASVSAHPAERRWGGGREDGNEDHPLGPPSLLSPILSPILSPERSQGAALQAPQCNLQSAVANMDLQSASSPAPLPQPNPALSLFHVAIGRGTQNYTCDVSNPSAAPVSAGAVATLFNVSCIAADMPALLQELPGIALNLPVPMSDMPLSPISQDVSGHHYFTDSTTPYFNLDTSMHSWGQGPMAKGSASSAPTGAIAGQMGQGNGAVTWLALIPKTGPVDRWQAVYRLNTAGGNPPTTCQGMPAAFDVQYAAEYWFFV